MSAFLEGGLNFARIPAVIESVMAATSGGEIRDLDDVLAADAEARARASRLHPATRRARIGAPRMNIGWNILWFIVGVSLLVTVHEFGHFWVARKLGFKVLRFSVGFGKPLLKTRRPGAGPHRICHRRHPARRLREACSTSATAPVPPADLPRAFTRKPPWQRILVLLAGPAANIVFAILVLWGMFWVKGVAAGASRWSATSPPDTPAADAGLRSRRR